MRIFDLSSLSKLVLQNELQNMKKNNAQWFMGRQTRSCFCVTHYPHLSRTELLV